MTAKPDPRTQTLTVNRLSLESGELLTDVTVAYRTWGRLSPRGDNAILVEHALTGVGCQPVCGVERRREERRSDRRAGADPFRPLHF